MNDNRTTNEIKLKRRGEECGRVGHIFNKFESKKQLFLYMSYKIRIFVG